MSERLPAQSKSETPSQPGNAASTRLPERTLPAPPPPKRLPDVEIVPRKRPTLEVLTEDVRNLPALPMSVLRVMHMIGDGSCASKDVAHVIQADPTFSVRVLKLANSAHYGLSRKVSTISEAVLLLGMRTVRNLAIAAATHNTMSKPLPGYELGAGDLWRHSVACALASQLLATMTGYREPEEAFVAGLLHDIGKVVLATQVSELMPDMRAYMEEHGSTFLDSERAVIGFDHAQIGGRIARKWNLPLVLIQTIEWHHEPVQDGKLLVLPGVVHVANAVCLIAGIGLGSDGLRTSVDPSVLDALRLDTGQIENVLGALIESIDESGALFEITRAEGIMEKKIA
jgi:putative nucleotidyltransferase with HDIG domain